MVEPLRPPPRPHLAERAAAALEFVGLGKLVAAAISVLALVAGGWWLLRTPDPPVERDLPYTAGAGTPSSATATHASMPAPIAAAPSTTIATIVVQIAGAVARPGVYAMPAGSRVHELLARAGGAAPGADPNALALAAPLVDGARVYVPKVGEVVSSTSGGLCASHPSGASAVPPSATAPIDLNRASADELDQLPGIGPSTAQAIVAYRDQHGPFGSVDDLLDVRGIGPAKLDAIRELVTT